MSSNYQLRAALARFDLGENRGNQALNALKRAIIELLRNEADSEAVFLGTMLVDMHMINSDNVDRTEIDVINGQITLMANPDWICYLNMLGIEYLIRELRHELTHLVLMHPEALSNETDELLRCVTTVAMNICVNEHLDTIRNLRSRSPLCPRCLVESGALSREEELIPVRIKQPKCELCQGCGHLDIDFPKISSVWTAHGGHIQRPYKTGVFDHAEFVRQIMDTMPAGAKNKGNTPNIYELGEKLLEYKDRFSKAIIDSTIHYAASQCSKSFVNGDLGDSPLLRTLRDLKRERRVPYILRIRGILGASVRDESMPTRFRPNRRFGYEYPGNKSIPKQRYVFAIDTSGSVDLVELKKMVNEFLNIRAYSDKIECRIIFFHHNVYLDKEVTEFSDGDLDKLESGGTDFDKVLSAVYLDESKERESDAVLMLYTDGYCDINIPRHKAGRNIYWLITPDGGTEYIRHWDRSANIIKITDR